MISTAFNMAALEAVPFDIWHEVAAYLEPQDYINAGIAIPVLRGALRDEATAKKAVRVWLIYCFCGS